MNKRKDPDYFIPEEEYNKQLKQDPDYFEPDPEEPSTLSKLGETLGSIGDVLDVAGGTAMMKAGASQAMDILDPRTKGSLENFVTESIVPGKAPTVTDLTQKSFEKLTGEQMPDAQGKIDPVDVIGGVGEMLVPSPIGALGGALRVGGRGLKYLTKNLDTAGKTAQTLGKVKDFIHSSAAKKILNSFEKTTGSPINKVPKERVADVFVEHDLAHLANNPIKMKHSLTGGYKLVPSSIEDYGVDGLNVTEIKGRGLIGQSAKEVDDLVEEAQRELDIIQARVKKEGMAKGQPEKVINPDGSTIDVESLSSKMAKEGTVPGFYDWETLKKEILNDLQLHWLKETGKRADEKALATASQILDNRVGLSFKHKGEQLNGVNGLMGIRQLHDFKKSLSSNLVNKDFESKLGNIGKDALAQTFLTLRGKIEEMMDMVDKGNLYHGMNARLHAQLEMAKDLENIRNISKSSVADIINKIKPTYIADYVTDPLRRKAAELGLNATTGGKVSLPDLWGNPALSRAQRGARDITVPFREDASDKGVPYEIPTEEVIRTPLPRDSRVLKEAPDLVKQKLAVYSPDHLDLFNNIQEFQPEMEKDFFMKLVREVPQIFEIDPQNKVDGQIPPDLHYGIAMSTLKEHNLSAADRIRKIQKLTTTGTV